MAGGPALLTPAVPSTQGQGRLSRTAPPRRTSVLRRRAAPARRTASLGAPCPGCSPSRPLRASPRTEPRARHTSRILRRHVPAGAESRFDLKYPAKSSVTATPTKAGGQCLRTPRGSALNTHRTPKTRRGGQDAVGRAFGPALWEHHHLQRPHNKDSYIDAIEGRRAQCRHVRAPVRSGDATPLPRRRWRGLPGCLDLPDGGPFHGPDSLLRRGPRPECAPRRDPRHGQTEAADLLQPGAARSSAEGARLCAARGLHPPRPNSER